MSISPPLAGEYLPYYHEYIRRVPAGDVLAVLQNQITESLTLLRGLSEAQVMQRPAPGEWNIKEVIGHLADGERLFSFRALCFARGEQAALPSFDPDAYVANGNFSDRMLADLCDEFAAIRQTSLYLFRSFAPEVTLRQGIASNNPISVRALIYICAGHEHHHMESIRQVYLAG